MQACNLILKCKECDNPNAELSRAKKLYSETGDAKAAVKLLNQAEGNCVESKLLQGLANSNVNDYVTALENVSVTSTDYFISLNTNKIISIDT